MKGARKVEMSHEIETAWEVGLWAPKEKKKI
jgi:hypothetical protein